MIASSPHGSLYLIPAPLGESELNAIIPTQVQEKIRSLEIFVVENAKTARAYFGQVKLNKPLQEITLLELNEHTPEATLTDLLQPLLKGKNVGLLSEAGCPAIADPGADLVRIAHQSGIRVVPLVGPSAILLALMASGLNGQQFAFHGYLPVEEKERIAKIREIENQSRRLKQTQIFIETPYRNMKMLESLLQHCQPQTQLCIACDITLPSELIQTRTISEWREKPPSISKRPTVFLFLA